MSLHRSGVIPALRSASEMTQKSRKPGITTEKVRLLPVAMTTGFLNQNSQFCTLFYNSLLPSSLSKN